MSNMHDSGKRQDFESGAVRDTADGKPRPDLISPHANLREGAWMEKGARKYAERNWEKGIPISRCVASMCRHLEAYKLGQTDEDHLAAIRTNASFIMHYEAEIKAGRMSKAIDDMPKYEQRPTSAERIQKAMDKVFGGGNMPKPEDIPPFSICSELRPGKWINPAYKQSPTVYIAGPMRGRPQLNIPEFDYVAWLWRKAGWRVINPAELDKQAGAEGATNMDAIIRRDVAAILDELRPRTQDGLVMLDGWSNSEGACAEYNLARWRGLTRYYCPHRPRQPREIK